MSMQVLKRAFSVTATKVLRSPSVSALKTASSTSAPAVERDTEGLPMSVTFYTAFEHDVVDRMNPEDKYLAFGRARLQSEAVANAHKRAEQLFAEKNVDSSADATQVARVREQCFKEALVEEKQTFRAQLAAQSKGLAQLEMETAEKFPDDLILRIGTQSLDRLPEHLHKQVNQYLHDAMPSEMQDTMQQVAEEEDYTLLLTKDAGGRAATVEAYRAIEAQEIEKINSMQLSAEDVKQIKQGAPLELERFNAFKKARLAQINAIKGNDVERASAKAELKRMEDDRLALQSGSDADCAKFAKMEAIALVQNVVALRIKQLESWPEITHDVIEASANPEELKRYVSRILENRVFDARAFHCYMKSAALQNSFAKAKQVYKMFHLLGVAPNQYVLKNMLAVAPDQNEKEIINELAAAHNVKL